MKRILVHLKEKRYELCIGVRLEDLGRYLGKYKLSRRALLVTHPRLRHLSRLVSKGLLLRGFDLGIAEFPEGEKSKSLKTVESLYRKGLQQQLDRRSVVISLGGGVVGDVTGFVAATYLRGVPLVHVPTTLLSMVDSSIGGKTGVDLPEGKNLVGAIYQPDLVWMDLSTLKTLSDREWTNGLAEVIKYGIISDPVLFKLLEKQVKSLRSNKNLLINIISRCAAIKVKVVEKDEKETRGIREILNFGHTFGHAIEAVTGFSRYAHGEAVAIGMCMASDLAFSLCLLDRLSTRRIQSVIEKVGLPIRLRSPIPARSLLSAMYRDKKVKQGILRFVLPKKIGKVRILSGVKESLIRQVLSQRGARL